MISDKVFTRLRGGALPLLVLSAACPAFGQDMPAPAPVSSNSPWDGTIDPQTVSDPVLKRLYAKSGWRSLWSPPDVAILEAALADRNRHGLDRVRFAPQQDASSTAAAQDVARTRAALDYATALLVGRVDPTALHSVYTVPNAKADVAAGLGAALHAGTLQAYLDALPPQDAEYRQLSDAYLQLSHTASTTSPETVPAGQAIRVGTDDGRVAAIAGQLRDSGYLLFQWPGATVETTGMAVPAVAPSRWTAEMAQALEALQRDYGIAADGVVGPETLKVLNLGSGDRLRALAVALERRRWLERTPPATRIDVNTAAAELRYYRDGMLVDRRKVVVGEANRETPPLSSPIYRLVANPTWTVPKSIQNGEMASVNEDYLQAHNMIIRDGWIVQQPGPDNALGLVKFDMANDQAIYLHDTAAPALFERSQRHLSHGCVRVENALQFADMLANDEGVVDAWQTAQASGEMTFVPLPKRIPVRMLYQNVFVGDDGAIAYRSDPYGWNGPIAEQLGFAKSSARTAEAQSIDIGP